jgi:hypothetical protein
MAWRKHSERIEMTPRLFTRLTALAAAGISALAIGAPSGAHADSRAGRPAAVDPAPELADFAVLAGSWTCRGTQPGSAGATIPTSAEVNAYFDFGGHWLVWDVVNHIGSGGPEKGVAYWGWDGGRGDFFLSSLNDAGFRADEHSPGWRGNRLVGDGRLVGPASAFPTRNFTDLDDHDTFRESGWLRTDGRWQQTFETTCRRTPQ